MEQIIFEVEGSAEEPYKVTFTKRSEGNLSAYCTCRAGDNGQYCKHRIAILSGDAGGIVSPNATEVKIVQSWLPGTDIEKAFQNVVRLEIEEARIKRELSAAKKDVAQAMRD